MNPNDQEGQWRFEPLAYALRGASDIAAGLAFIALIVWAVWP